MKNNFDIGDCPKCGYYLIKIHPTARCAKGICGYEDSWENYHELFAKKEGFKSKKHMDSLKT